MIAQALRNVLPDKVALNLLASVLESTVKYGSLELIDPWEIRHSFGTQEAPFVSVRITDPRELARLVENPNLRAGEAYMEGTFLLERSYQSFPGCRI